MSVEIEPGPASVSVNSASPDPVQDGAPPTTLGAPQSRSRARLFLALRILVIVGIAVGIARTVISEWDKVVVAVQAQEPLWLLFAFTCICLGIFSGARVWHVVLHELGSEVPYLRAAQISLVGQLGKYLPGSLWAFVLQTELSRKAGIPRARAFTALLVATGVTIVAAMTLAPLALPWIDRWYVQVAFILAPLSLITLHPKVLDWLVGTALTVLRRPQPSLDIAGRDVLRTLGWSYVAATCFGLSLWALFQSVATPDLGGVVRCIVAMALAMTLGVLVFVAPSGLGVREAFIVAALMPTVPKGTALGLALVSRMLFIAADLLTAGIAVVTARVALRGEPPADAAGTITAADTDASYS